MVRGPNVMVGYLKADKPGVLEPPPDGWHDTGDIVTIDDKGFVTIRGRAKRFAKVGGEMISLAAVETLACELWPEHLSAVVAVPDARKGERLILATQKKDATRAELIAFAKQQHAADLMIPSEVMIFEKLPLLGSGKVDLMSLAKLVDERLAAKPEPARAQA
jgi:acyl-[acyl-carrier-protein]-phospholipid O-acyltransferase/long-chain-fatty-acid--[acyl-carrier-protein] ligase